MPDFGLDELLAELQKEFGKGAATYASALKPREYRTSGSIALDLALGGGYGKSTIVDVIGKQSAGKTLLFEMAAVAAQREEGLASALFDYEGTFDPSRFVALGGDTNGLVLIRAENFGVDVKELFLEWAADMMKSMLKSGKFALICHDSTAAMVSKAEYTIKEEKGEEASTMAYTARGMSSVLRQIVGTGLVARSGTTVFYLSQMRDNIGARAFKGMPPPDKRTGGRALPFYASTQVEVSRGDLLKADVDNGGVITKDAEVGHETKVRVRKNKNNAVQGRVASFDLYSEGEVSGLDKIGELQQLSVLTGVVQKDGSYYTVPGVSDRAHGKDQLRSMLSHQETFKSVLAATRQALDLTQRENALPAEVLTASEFEDDDAIMEKLMRDA